MTACGAVRRRRWASSAIAIGVIGLLAACGGSPNPATPAAVRTATTSAPGPASATPLASASQKDACDLITHEVISAAHFTYRVVRQTPSTGLGKNGPSACTYGDDPDTTHISSNFLLLLILTPAALKAQHTTAVKKAKASTSPCPADAVREFGPSEGIGSYLYFCVKPAHAPDGAWVQGSNLYVLEVGGPDVDYGTTKDRETEFEAVARAISNNVGR